MNFLWIIIKKNSLENKKLDKIKIEKLNKISSIILSIHISYYIRLSNIILRSNFDFHLKKYFIDLVNYEQEENDKFEENNLLDKINEPLKSFIINQININNLNYFNNFSDILLLEENYLLKEIELEKDIGNIKALRESVFLLFISLITNIPLIIIGKPGSGKSLSSQLIYKSMRGKESKSKLFQLYPSIIQSYYKCSNTTSPEDVEKIFEIAEGKLKSLIEKGEKKENLPILMILFDELELAERSKYNPLKVLHSKLEYDRNKNGISFIGISNCILDSLIINRVFCLSVVDLDDNINNSRETSIIIAKSFNEKYKDNIIIILQRWSFP